MNKTFYIYVFSILTVFFSCESKSKQKFAKNRKSTPKNDILGDTKLFSTKNKNTNLKIASWNIQKLGRSKITQEIFDKVFAETRPSVSKSELEEYKKLKDILEGKKDGDEPRKPIGF